VPNPLRNYFFFAAFFLAAFFFAGIPVTSSLRSNCVIPTRRALRADRGHPNHHYPSTYFRHAMHGRKSANSMARARAGLTTGAEP